MTARWITAEVFDGLATVEDGSVDLIVTSPPFLALRSYLPADHPDKSKEIGSEATPAEFIDTLLAVTAELRRVLAPHGSICVELGDTYAGSGEAGWHRAPEMAKPQRAAASADGWLDGVPRVGDGWPLTKSRALIPQLYEIALAYGINPLTGQPSPAGQWRIRNVVTWARPNPPVGALGDKWRPATSDVVVACTSSKRYWDDLATRRPFKQDVWSGGITFRAGALDNSASPPQGPQNQTTAGAPLLDYWEIPPGGYPGSHYAVFPPELVVPCVKAMCPEKVCRTCGEPSRRLLTKQATWDRQPELAAHIKERREALGITSNQINEWFGYKEIAKNWERTDQFGAAVPNAKDWPILKKRLGLSDDFDSFIIDRRYSETDYYSQDGQSADVVERVNGDFQGSGSHGKKDGGKTADRREFGFTDCGHDDYRPGIVLDPFAGSGTTLAVATGHGHDAIGIDLDPRNADLARDRIGPFLFEEVTV